MPIGLVEEDQWEQELRKLGVKTGVSSGSPSEVVIEELESPGRKEGDNNVPDSLRKIIGEEAVINGRQSALALASSFGISPSSVSAYAKGATSTSSYHSPTQSIISHINKSRRRAVRKASNTLNQALGAITQDKLDNCDAKDLSGIAKDMSAVIKNLEPRNETPESETSAAPQFVIFAPQFRKEESFDVITVNE